MQELDPIQIDEGETAASPFRLTLRGSMGLDNVRDLHLAAEELASRGRDVEVDCSGPTRLDLAAIQVLIALAIDLGRAGHECRVLGVPPGTKRHMEFAGL